MALFGGIACGVATAEALQGPLEACLPSGSDASIRAVEVCASACCAGCVFPLLEGALVGVARLGEDVVAVCGLADAVPEAGGLDCVRVALLQGPLRVGGCGEQGEVLGAGVRVAGGLVAVGEGVGVVEDVADVAGFLVLDAVVVPESGGDEDGEVAVGVDLLAESLDGLGGGVGVAGEELVGCGLAAGLGHCLLPRSCLPALADESGARSGGKGSPKGSPGGTRQRPCRSEHGADNHLPECHVVAIGAGPRSGTFSRAASAASAKRH